MVPALPRQRDLLEQALLERFGPQLDRTQKDDGSGRGTSRFGGKPGGVIRDEIAAVPIALEHRGDLVDDVGISRTRHPDVPFEAADLRRVRQIRRADVDRREPRPSMKQPRLRVQARGADVIRHADVRAEIAERVKGSPFSGPCICRREHAQFTAALAMAAKSIEQRSDAATANERHDEVDAIG